MSFINDSYNSWRVIAAVGILTCSFCVTTMIVIRRLLLYLIQVVKKKHESAIQLYFDNYFVKCLCLTVLIGSLWFIAFSFVIEDEKFYILFLSVVFTVMMNILVIVLDWLHGYDDVDLVKSQSHNMSIGAFWARGAYEAYYKVLFEDWHSRVTEYEASGKQLCCRNLILICPLSCDVRGKLDEKSQMIKLEGNLEVIECDQGANINRKYKNPVYKIGDEENAVCVVSEYPSSLGTLWEVREKMDEQVWVYHRDCFLKHLKELLRNEPCTILEYNDCNPAAKEPLDTFLLSNLH